MTTRRDKLLQELGITQWILRKPAVLQGEVAISLEHIRLLIVVHKRKDMAHPLLSDILRSMTLLEQQVLVLSLDKVMMLPEKIHCLCWCPGITEPLMCTDRQLYSPSLAQLTQDPAAKRALWQQLCHYEQYFSFNHRRSGSRFSDRAELSPLSLE